MTIRTRFAPSPTGYLHIGSARTALYAWLFAKKEAGKFILRIEDTDSKRSTQESVDAILEGMAWLGLDYDEGPFYQTERMARYEAVIAQLLDAGQAYRCYCSKERIIELREAQLAAKQKPRYDGHCREGNSQSPQQAHVVRFKNPLEGEVVIDDQVFGHVRVHNRELDDLIIARSDGTPTYNFTVVVDDWDMRISHVIRGDDHLNNTPRQINILRALGADIPVYAHLPMLLGEDKKRLSKRHGAVGVQQYRDEGILPDALINYLVRLGWSHGDQEIFSREEMIRLFSLEEVNKSAAALNHNKLLWLNQHYLKHDSVEITLPHLARQFKQANVDVNAGPDLGDILAIQAERCKTLKDMLDKSRFFYEDVTQYDEKAARKHLKPDSLEILRSLHEQFTHLQTWEKAALHDIIITTGEHFDVKLGKIAQPLRVALTGNTISPPIDVTLQLMGKPRSLARIEKALHYDAASNAVA